MVKKSKKQTEKSTETTPKVKKEVKSAIAATKEETPVKKLRDNLDALFKEAKQKKDVNDEKREKEAKKKAKKEERMKKMEFEAINEMKAVNGDPIRIDKETGLKVYREDQLNLGKGGNTPLCPFDCDCCF